VVVATVSMPPPLVEVREREVAVVAQWSSKACISSMRPRCTSTITISKRIRKWEKKSTVITLAHAPAPVDQETKKEEELEKRDDDGASNDRERRQPRSPILSQCAHLASLSVNPVWSKQRG
jgi:hypothetical protein